jgi:hypothetical protein
MNDENACETPDTFHIVSNPDSQDGREDSATVTTATSINTSSTTTSDSVAEGDDSNYPSPVVSLVTTPLRNDTITTSTTRQNLLDSATEPIHVPVSPPCASPLHSPTHHGTCQDPDSITVNERTLDIQPCQDPDTDTVNKHTLEIQPCQDPNNKTVDERTARMQPCQDPDSKTVNEGTLEIQPCQGPDNETVNERTAGIQPCQDPDNETVDECILEMQPCQDPDTDTVNEHTPEIQPCRDPDTDTVNESTLELQPCQDPDSKTVNECTPEIQPDPVESLPLTTHAPHSNNNNKSKEGSPLSHSTTRHCIVINQHGFVKPAPHTTATDTVCRRGDQILLHTIRQHARVGPPWCTLADIDTMLQSVAQYHFVWSNGTEDRPATSQEMERVVRHSYHQCLPPVQRRRKEPEKENDINNTQQIRLETPTTTQGSNSVQKISAPASVQQPIASPERKRKDNDKKKGPGKGENVPLLTSQNNEALIYGEWDVLFGIKGKKHPGTQLYRNELLDLLLENDKDSLHRVSVAKLADRIPDDVQNRRCFVYKDNKWVRASPHETFIASQHILNNLACSSLFKSKVKSPLVKAKQPTTSSINNSTVNTRKKVSPFTTKATEPASLGISYTDNDILLGDKGYNHPGTCLFRKAMAGVAMSHQAAGTTIVMDEWVPEIKSQFSASCFLSWGGDGWRLATDAEVKFQCTHTYYSYYSKTVKKRKSRNNTTTATTAKQSRKRPRIQNSHTDSDILFGLRGHSHPGTKECQQVVKDLLKENQGAIWDDAYAKIIQDRLSGRRFFVYVASRWREASGAEIIAKLLNMYRSQLPIQRQNQKVGTDSAAALNVAAQPQAASPPYRTPSPYSKVEEVHVVPVTPNPKRPTRKSSRATSQLSSSAKRAATMPPTVVSPHVTKRARTRILPSSTREKDNSNSGDCTSTVSPKAIKTAKSLILPLCTRAKAKTDSGGSATTTVSSKATKTAKLAIPPLSTRAKAKTNSNDWTARINNAIAKCEDMKMKCFASGNLALLPKFNQQDHRIELLKHLQSSIAKDDQPGKSSQSSWFGKACDEKLQEFIAIIMADDPNNDDGMEST